MGVDWSKPLKLRNGTRVFEPRSFTTPHNCSSVEVKDAENNCYLVGQETGRDCYDREGEFDVVNFDPEPAVSVTPQARGDQQALSMTIREHFAAIFCAAIVAKHPPKTNRPEEEYDQFARGSMKMADVLIKVLGN